MDWWLVHTKPRQEIKALHNLEAQDFECYLPLFPVEVLQRGSFQVNETPLFPRYLFCRAGKNGAGENWGVIRSTSGVNRLVCFGSQPAKVNDQLVSAIRQQSGLRTQAKPIFTQGEKLQISHGPFAGLQAIYEMKTAEDRVLVLISLMSKQVRLTLEPSKLLKTS